MSCFDTRLSRRRALALFALTAPLCSAKPAAGPRILVITTSGAPAYLEAVEGLRGALEGAAALTVTTVDRAGAAAAHTALASNPDLVVAVGSSALEVVIAARCEPPLLATMVLDSEPAGEAGSSVTLDLPPGEVLARVKQMFPDRRRIAVIRGPALGSAAVAEIHAQGRRFGFELTFAPCAGAKELLEAPAAARGKADFLWCLPDRGLYQPAAVSALTLTSIRHGLPLIGFSEGIVRAGALVGFYPDYRDIGRQTAESALRIVAEKQRLHEHPRKVRGAVNERVARVLGVSIRRASAEMVSVQ